MLERRMKGRALGSVVVIVTGCSVRTERFGEAENSCARASLAELPGHCGRHTLASLSRVRRYLLMNSGMRSSLL
jgi:hypothetical protein